MAVGAGGKREENQEILMTEPIKVKKMMEHYYDLAGELIKNWYETRHHIETGVVTFETTDDLVKFIHKEELQCRKLTQLLPGIKCIQLCMIIYGETVYGAYQKYHKDGKLHILVAEAIRILHYGQSPERERYMLSARILFELFEHIQIMIEAKEFTQMAEVGILCDLGELRLEQGHFFASNRDAKVLTHFRAHYGGKGLRLRMGTQTGELFSKDAKNSLWKRSNFAGAIQKLLSEPVSGRDIAFFKGTYYEFLPAVAECDDTYREFLEKLLERVEFEAKIFLLAAQQYAFLYSSSQYNMEEAGRVLGNPVVIPKEMVKEDMVFVPEWKRWKIEEGSRIAILNTPVIKSYDGKYATTFWLYADSVNSWVEEFVYRENTAGDWKMKISQTIENQFEEEVAAFMRKFQFEAGQVKQNGVWYIGNVKEKNLAVTLPGQVDVLAVSHGRKKVYLIECKCLHDMLSAEGNVYKKSKSINQKLRGAFVQKLKKKREKIIEYMENNLPDYDLTTAVLTDLDFPVYLLGEERKEWENFISICSFQELQEAVVKNKDLISYVGHI